MKLCKRGHDKEAPGGLTNQGRCRRCLNRARAKYQKTAKGRATVVRFRATANGKNHNVLGQKKHRYGMSREQFFRFFAESGSRCAICRRPLRWRGERYAKDVGHVDHDHATKRVRGLLCPRCNLGLGHFDDSSERLFAAAVYLEGSKR